VLKEQDTPNTDLEMLKQLWLHGYLTYHAYREVGRRIITSTEQKMKAVIYLDVPEWQIGQDVTIYFPDTMLKHGKCELLKEQENGLEDSIRNFINND
jgi:hypothetical protein